MTRTHIYKLRLLAGALLLGSAFCVLNISTLSSAQGVAAPGPADNSNYIDRIHPGDVIDIHVAGYYEFDWRGGINPEGFLDGYDKIATPIHAQCKTLSELSREIEKVLSETLRDPKTEIKFADRSKRQLATIDGAIQTPMRLQIRRSVKLSEIIVKAGGFTDRASGNLIISRPAGASCIGDPASVSAQRFDIALADLLAGKAELDPVIVSGDLIVVIEASPVFLLGAVQGQGRIDFRPDLTVSRAIDSAGGLAKNADVASVKIFRREGGSKIIPVDLEEIRGKRTDDIALRPFDIIDVPFKGKPPRKLPPVTENEAEQRERRSRLPVKIIE